jgi:hypothetical protein
MIYNYRNRAVFLSCLSAGRRYQNSLAVAGCIGKVDSHIYARLQSKFWAECPRYKMYDILNGFEHIRFESEHFMIVEHRFKKLGNRWKARIHRRCSGLALGNSSVFPN